MARLLNHGGEPIILHSGMVSLFKIDADALTVQDCDAVAHLLGPHIGPFGSVESVPSTCGVPRWLAHAFEPYVSGHAFDWPLIVDDVLNTGLSMETQRAGRNAHGVVIFSWGEPPDWITPVLTVSKKIRHLLV